jgi:hypothetical protein
MGRWDKASVPVLVVSGLATEAKFIGTGMRGCAILIR